MAKSSDSKYLGTHVKSAPLSKIWIWVAGLALASQVALAPGCTRSPQSTGGKPESASEEKAAFLGGGSGERAAPNFFVEDLHDLDGRLRARGWKTTLVTPPHSSTDRMLRGVQDTLASVKSGGQALIVIHTHGRERETVWGQRSHSVSSEDTDSSGAEIGLDLDAIEQPMIQAKARGVRVALVDLSCYSGATQALKGASCTITLASQRYVSLCSGREEERLFNSRFLKLPSPGVKQDLESQFLEARRLDVDSINLPQISSIETPIRGAWEAFLTVVDPIDTFEELKDFKKGAKSLDTRAWIAELDAWLKAREKAPGFNAAEARKLRDSIALVIKQAVERRKSLESQMAALARDHDEASLAVQVPGRDPLKIGPAYLAEMLRDSEPGAPEPNYSGAQKSLAQALVPMKDELLATHAKAVSAYDERRGRYDDDVQALSDLAGSLFRLERELYSLGVLTTGESGQGGARTSCREFAL